MRRSNIVAAAQSILKGHRSSPRSLHAKLLIAVFVGALLGGTAAWWVFPQKASASISCFGGGGSYNTVATNNATQFADYGTRVQQMNVYGGGADGCVRISSIESNAPDGSEAEIGWHTQAVGVNNCGTGDNVRHIFYTWKAYGSYQCHEDRTYSLVEGQKYDFSVRYNFSSVNGWYWIYNFSGNILTQHDNGFNYSQPSTNGERHSDQDSATSHFIGMQFRADNITWQDWGHSACEPTAGQPNPYGDPESNDPVYNNQLLSNTEVLVSQQAPQC